jgi:two-component system, OmpR family, heavy metal sensor histidine kinase CusS
MNTAALSTGTPPPAAPGAPAALKPATAACSGALCSHSIGTRLSRKLAVLTMIILGLLSWGSWTSIGMLIRERNAQDLDRRCALYQNLLELEARNGGEAAVLTRLHADAAMRSSTRLEVWTGDGRLLHADPLSAVLAQAQRLGTHEFKIDAPGLPGGAMRARLSVDFSHDAQMGRRWGWIMALVTLAAGALVAAAARWHVRRELSPLRQLAVQTRAISPQRLDQRLHLADPAEELLPWVEQFNALMQRLERAYGQLEAFNANVAHELRTPLTALIGQTEVALSRERSNEVLRDTLASNLEEMQRLSAMVNDMLFLAQAERGAVARRGEARSLSELARQVVEFHEATLEDAGLLWRIEGDVTLAVDEPLFKRALSNLLGNATRFAERGSTVLVRISADLTTLPEQVQVVVQNQGQAIAPQHLPQLFDRFFRADDSRHCPNEQHHGLGLAIVSAIARMHAGRTVAHSQAGTTSVGFTLATG